MRRQIVGSLILLPALFLGSTVSAETRYVVTTGTNNPDCSVVWPCRTCSHAVSIAALGSLFEDSSCGAFWPGQAIVGVSPKLQPLKLNGGRTFTHALRKGSPAIDAANVTYCQPVDQRGVSRYVDGDGDGGVRCDIGAYEYVPFTRGWLIDQ